MNPRMQLVVLFTATALGCGGGGDSTGVTPAPGAITVSLSAPSLNVTQGQSGTLLLTLARKNGFSGPVDLLIEGAPAGVTVTCTPSTIPVGAASSSLEVAVARTAVAATYSLTVRGRASGVSDQIATFSLTVGVAGAYTISVSPANVSVPQGSSVASNVSILRTGGFSDAVALTVSGAPAGVTAVVSPASLSGAATTATLTITAAANAAVGNYSLIAHGSAAGLNEQTATLPVQLTAAASGTSVTLKYCDSNLPIWFAIQNEGGAWTRVAGSAGSFTFTVSTRGAIATVTSGDGVYETRIIYASGAELTAIGQASVASCTHPGQGSKSLRGSVANIATTQTADISMADAFATVIGTGSNAFILTQVPDVPADLIAVRQNIPSGLTLMTDKVIVRRGVNLPTGATMPTLDFAASEAIAPANANLTLSNVGGDSVFVLSGFLTATNSSATITQAFGTTQFVFSGLPTSQLIAGDVQFVAAAALSPTAFNSDREVFAFTHSITDQTLALGPALASPAISTVSAAAPRQLRAQLAVQTAYPNNVEVDFLAHSSGPIQFVALSMTAAYLGGSASSWDVTIPDLSAAGYDASWGLPASTPVSWTVTASSLPSILSAGLFPPEGTYASAERSADSATLNVMRREPRRPSPLRLWQPVPRTR
jgi:hypothetical protein